MSYIDETCMSATVPSRTYQGYARHLDRDIRPCNAHECARKHGEHRKRSAQPSPLYRVHPALQMVRVVQPEESGDAVGVRRCEERRGDTGEVREDRDGAREDECNGDGGEAEEDPRRPSEDGVRVNVAGVPEEPDEKKLGGEVRIECAGAACDGRLAVIVTMH